MFKGIRFACVTVALLAAPARASLDGVDGVLSPFPVDAQTCLAVRIDLPSGQALAGIQWFHNDGSVPFPEVLFMEGDGGSPPDLSDTGMLLDQVVGESLSWGEAPLSQPVVSSTGVVYAVFVFPPYEEMAWEGEGGGPGIGYREGAGATAYLSLEGEEWIRFDPAHSIAIEPVLSLAKGGSVVLGSLEGTVSWDQPGEPVEATAARTRLLPPSPNPFNPRTTIRFSLEAASSVRLVVYNIRGQEVRILADEYREPGHHAVIWDGTDTRGRSVASGIYLVHMEALGRDYHQRISLLR
jgi:hypothetical protein